MADKQPFGWIGVDFDGTLAHYDKWMGPEACGQAIQPMVDRVMEWRKAGREVRIFTARVYPLLYVGAEDQHADCAPEGMMDKPIKISAERLQNAIVSVRFLREWCRQHFGEVLPITCVKDFHMAELWDDRCVQVEKNTGRVMELPADWGYKS